MQVSYTFFRCKIHLSALFQTQNRSVQSLRLGVFVGMSSQPQEKKKLSPLWRRKLDDVPLSNILTKRGSKLTAVIYTSLYYFSLMYYRIISNIICNVIILHIFFCLLYTKMSWKQSHNLFVYSLVYLLSLCGKDHESSQKGTVPFSWLTSLIITAITAELSQIHWVIFGPHNISGDSLQNRDAAFP